MNNHLFVTSEHGRKIDCMAMIGVIDHVDLTQNPPVATVDVDDFTTDWLPMGLGRAGPNTDWDPYEPGEQVLVISPYGDPSQGVIVCAINQNQFPPPTQSADQWRKQFKDGTFVQYDRAAHMLTVDTTQSQGSVTINCQAATVNAAQSVTLQTPTTHITGNLQVDGNATINGNADIQGAANVQGNTTLANVTSNGMDVGNQHYHKYNGNPTTPPVG